MNGFKGLFLGALSFFATLLWVPLLVFLGQSHQSCRADRADVAANTMQLNLRQVYQFTWVYVGLFFAFCAALIVVFGTHAFKVRWFTPFLFWVPPVLVLWMIQRGGSLKAFNAVAVSLLTLVGFLFVFRAPLVGWAGQPSWLNMPAKELSQQLNQDFPSSAVLLTPDIRLAGSVRLHSPERTVMYPAYPVFAKYQTSMACQVLLLQGDFETTPMLAGWSVDMLEAVADHWKLPLVQVQQMAQEAQSKEVIYSHQALYSSLKFNAKALMLTHPNGCLTAPAS
jgi:hypothetical protein